MDENFSTSIIVIMVLVTTVAAALLPLQSTKVAAGVTTTPLTPVFLVPIAISDDNFYVTWSTNKTGNYEVMFRDSTDGGTT
jgi:hypothetical protein